LDLATNVRDYKKYNFRIINIQSDKDSIMKNKIFHLYQKNKEFQVLEQIRLIISGNNEIQTPENFNPCSVASMKYAPLMSVYSDRSFSLYEHILRELSDETLYGQSLESRYRTQKVFYI